VSRTYYIFKKNLQHNKSAPERVTMWPKVGVSVIVLARSSNLVHVGHVALIRRAHPPAEGLYSFPGGKLHLGETISECAIREAREEIGLSCVVHNTNVPAFAVTDSITHGVNNKIDFHYAVAHVLAMTQCNDGEGRLILPKLLAGDDADDALWVRVDDLIASDSLSNNCVTSSSGRKIDRSMLVTKMSHVLISLKAHLKTLTNL
jgi:ADP-ribose pyrophosphatase YjhB (NUDIX family)